MAVDKTPPRLLELVKSNNWPQIAPSKPEMPLTVDLSTEEKLDHLGTNFALDLQNPVRVAAKNDSDFRKKTLAWITAEAIEQGPYASLPESLKTKLRDKIADLLFSAPDILA